MSSVRETDWGWKGIRKEENRHTPTGIPQRRIQHYEITTNIPQRGIQHHEITTDLPIGILGNRYSHW